METTQIISWLRDKADRAQNISWTRMMHTAADRLLVLENRQRWIPVTEKLPKKDQEVLVYEGGGIKPEVHSYIFWHKDFPSWSGVTHWMPMPEHPKN